MKFYPDRSCYSTRSLHRWFLSFYLARLASQSQSYWLQTVYEQLVDRRSQQAPKSWSLCRAPVCHYLSSYYSPASSRPLLRLRCLWRIFDEMWSSRSWSSCCMLLAPIATRLVTCQAYRLAEELNLYIYMCLFFSYTWWLSLLRLEFNIFFIKREKKKNNLLNEKVAKRPKYNKLSYQRLLILYLLICALVSRHIFCSRLMRIIFFDEIYKKKNVYKIESLSLWRQCCAVSLSFTHIHFHLFLFHKII